ncbi:MAG: twitching motility protein PilT [Nitrosopumilales archaeon]|nr:twitching motility protein PilT [Nitrosopumilales archaeon]
MVEVVCDTSFLIHIATKRIKNISNLETEIGSIQFVVPDIVIQELEKLSKNDKKKQHIISTLEFIKNLKEIKISGTYVDESIISYTKKYGGIIATMDTNLKHRIKEFGGSVISISNDKIVLEPSKI